jgi:hypothetical protein
MGFIFAQVRHLELGYSRFVPVYVIILTYYSSRGNLAKTVALETYTKKVTISDLWLKTSLLMTFEFCFIVLEQIPGNHLKPHNCIILRH